MGLFGAKKEQDERTVRITELFTEEGLLKIKKIVGPKVAGRAYASQYMEMASDLLAAACDTDKIYGKKELTKLIFATGAMTKLEPSLNPVLKPAIEKYQAMKKNKAL